MHILKDEKLQEHLDIEGYAVFDALKPERVAEVLTVFDQFKSQLPAVNGLHITLEHAEEQVRTNVAETLMDMLSEDFSHVFQDHKVFQGSFIYKESGRDDNPVPLHQDWTFVDEPSGQESYTLWVALCDISEETGAVGVIPGSHRELDQIRYTPNEMYTGYEKIAPYAVERPVKYILLKAGQALLWNHKLVHNSLPNTSKTERRNASFCITGAAARLKNFFCSPKDGSVMDLHVPDDFYLTHNSKSFMESYNKEESPLGPIIKLG
jgi:ectoine hydroxylase-related dioxygenase (phytanoyl-CoA dioxygenase family)